MRNATALMMLFALSGGILTLQAQTRHDIGRTRSPNPAPAPTVSTPSREPVRSDRPVQPSPPSPPPSVPAPVAVPSPVIVVSPPVVVVVPTGGTDIVGTPLAGSAGLPEREEPAVRFPMMGVEISDCWTEPDFAGYNFEDNTVVQFNDDDVDLSYDGRLKRINVPSDTDIQDLGTSNSVKEGLRIDKDGWASMKSVEVKDHHQYAVWLWDGDVVKVYVKEIHDDGFLFDWMPGAAMARSPAGGQLFGR